LSLSLTIPVQSQPDVNATSLAAVIGPLLAGQNAQSALLQLSPQTNHIAASTGGVTAVSNALDPLTPRGATPAANAALSLVIAKVQSNLQGISGSVSRPLTQVVQSPVFQQLLQGLAAGQSNSSGSVNPQPYFQKMLGELESAYAPSGVPAASSLTAFNTSEVDLFLKWLSLNEGGALIASA
jgi:hypothetical protein